MRFQLNDKGVSFELPLPGPPDTMLKSLIITQSQPHTLESLHIYYCGSLLTSFDHLSGPICSWKPFGESGIPCHALMWHSLHCMAKGCGEIDITCITEKINDPDLISYISQWVGILEYGRIVRVKDGLLSFPEKLISPFGKSLL